MARMTNLKCQSVGVKYSGTSAVEQLNEFLLNKNIYKITPLIENSHYGTSISHFIVIYYDEPVCICGETNDRNCPAHQELD